MARQLTFSNAFTSICLLFLTVILIPEVSAQPAEINITGNAINIANGDATPQTADGTDFGAILVGNNSSSIFTIQNLGVSNLNLTGTTKVMIFGPDAADFSVTANPDTIIAGSSSTTFTVQFSPSSVGFKSAYISIENSDSNEDPYNFSIQGNGATSLVSINLASSSLTSDAAVQFDLTFADNISGLSAFNFSLNTTGTISGASISSVSGSGTSWAVIVNTGTGDGSLGLDMVNSTGVTPVVGNLTFNGPSFSIDKTAPSVTCPFDLNTAFDANCVYTFQDYTGGASATDNVTSSGNLVWSQSPTAGSQTSISPVVINIYATDEAGNTGSCTFNITIYDITQPTVNTKNVTVALDASANASITANDINNGSTDNCGIDTMTLDVSSFNCSDVGNNTVTLTVTDIHGNTNSSTATVTVEDNIAPTVVTQNITVTLNGSGNASITANDIDNGSSDNCSIQSMSLDVTSFNCSDVGNNTVTLTVTDVNGNSANATATVTVEDNTAPTVVTKNATVALDASGNASITTSDINNGSSDNCGIQSMSLDVTSFNCSDVGNNTVTLTVTDVNGNSANSTATVTVEDNIAPTVVTQNITVALNASGNASITASQINNGSSDNCSIQSISLNVSSFDCSDVGNNTVTLTVTDVNGNSANGTATVTVEDNIAPAVLTQNITISLNASGSASITASQINNGSSDNCSIQSMSLDVSSFDCSDLGANTVTLTVTDVNGNSANATATVTVEDNTAPVAATRNIDLYLDTFGEGTIAPSDVDNGSSDACGSLNLALDKTTFDCSNVGPNTVTLTVTDGSGNLSTKTATVTVHDTIAPGVFTKNIAWPLDANGQAVISAGMVNQGSFDFCGIQSMSIDKTTFDCSNIGANSVVLTVTDVNGNAASKTVTVTILDISLPVVTPKTATVYLDASGQGTIVASDVYQSITDNCGVSSATVNKTNFSCIDLGNNTVTLTVTDANLNVKLTQVTVTVMDTVAPFLVSKNVNIYLDQFGYARVTPIDVYPIVDDNCQIGNVVVEANEFDCDDMNVTGHPVLVTISDAKDNITYDTVFVTILDSIAPNLVCPADMDICEGTLDYPTPDYQDNCLASFLQSAGPETGNYIEPGNYTITYEAFDQSGNRNECTFNLNVKAAPVVNLGNDTIVSAGTGIQLTATGDTSYASLLWSDGSDRNNLIVNVQQDTMIWVEATGDNGCMTRDTINLRITTGIKNGKLASGELKVYPNPTTGTAYLQLTGIDTDDVNIAVYATDGRLVKVVDQHSWTGDQNVIDLSDMDQGVYFLNVQSEQFSKTVSIVKQ